MAARVAHARPQGTASPGTSSRRRQSAVLVPVPDAEALVGPWRRRFDPVAAAGVPAHVTVIVPWIDPDEITGAEIGRLTELADATKAFDFRLTAAGFFEGRVLWLAPDPARPFLQLTAAVAERFGTPPWADAFEEVVPHVTVAHAAAGVELGSVARLLEPALPVSCRAEELWVMVADGDRWEVRARLPLA